MRIYLKTAQNSETASSRPCLIFGSISKILQGRWVLSLKEVRNTMRAGRFSSGLDHAGLMNLAFLSLWRHTTDSSLIFVKFISSHGVKDLSNGGDGNAS